MKKSMLAMIGCVFTMSTIVTSCSSPAEKVENAQNNLIKAREELNEANEEYLIDIENYRKETAANIAANEKSIADFKARKEEKKKEVRADYLKKIDELERQNSDMKKRMDDYKSTGKEDWEKFKREFNRDMDELGKAFKDFIIKNVK